MQNNQKRSKKIAYAQLKANQYKHTATHTHTHNKRTSALDASQRRPLSKRREKGGVV